MNITLNDNLFLILKDKITNPYYLTFLNAELVAVLEGLPEEHPDCNKYLQSCNGVSAVFMLKNPETFNEKPRSRKDYFLFDKEWDLCHHDDPDERAFARAYVEQNPVILYFKGSDDNSVGLRFPNEEKAMSYLNELQYFEDVLKNPLLNYDN